ncbi:MAG TPA: alpha/beta family hydrolase [Gemmatimonadales bacterium]|nr:alpha/beta family hydrolase [Gemmatimonadales bacterium]
MTQTIITRGSRAVSIPAGGVQLAGDLAWPDHPGGIVLFAHGSGSGRLSPRNQFVAGRLRNAGLATLLFDLLTEREAADRHNVFDIPLLARRLVAATTWAREQSELAGLAVGYFGASTGAAAAITAAALSPVPVAAIVSRGGRPDLAGNALARVTAPTLLLVGSRDPVVLDLNRAALTRLRGPRELVIVPGAGHLFEERGTLEAVADAAAGWFVRYLEMAQTWRGARGRNDQSAAAGAW